MLLISMLSAGFVACSDETSDSDSDTTVTETEAVSETATETEEITEELPDVTYDGHSVRFLVRPVNTAANTDWGSDIFSDGETGEIVADAVYLRNQKVSERFDVNFEKHLSSSAVAETDAMKSILANEDAYDVVAAHGRSAFKYAEEGMCLDWEEDLEYVDLDKPWWYKDAREGFTINGKLYTMTGTLSYLSIAYANCMLFNKAIFDDYSVEYPYETVAAGEWTFDKFANIAKMCSSDLNGDNEYTPDSDMFGYVTYYWVGPIQTLIAGGGRIAGTDSDGQLVLTINNERNHSIYEDYFSLLDTQNCYLELNRDHNMSKYNAYKLFAEGRAMLLDCHLYDIQEMRDMEEDFGIIPTPKYDESQEMYLTSAGAGTNYFIVPITAQASECISVVLEALCAESYRTVVPAYYETTLKVKYSRDDLSVQMLDLIRDGIVYDIGFFYCGGSLMNFGCNLALDPDHSFASLYAKEEAKVQAVLDEINDSYGY